MRTGHILVRVTGLEQMGHGADPTRLSNLLLILKEF